MQPTLAMFLIVCPLVFLGGFVDSIAGGGGLLTLPAYYVAGLPPALAGGTNKLSALFGTAVATGKYVHGGKVNWKHGLLSLAGAFPGAMLGAWALTVLPQLYVKAGVVLALPLVALVVLKNKDLTPHRLADEKWDVPLCLGVGVLIGVYDGLIGPGTGTFLLLAYLNFLGDEALTASGTAKLVNLGTNLGAFFALGAAGSVLYALALPAAAFGVAGNWLGATLALKNGVKAVRTLLIIVLAMLLVKLVWDTLPLLL
ncbi:MAG TPA: TSUP family transporter [Candidatus Limnocylindria bacterium]|nr:TSUP family transporter [Candidatus Limnocylindria bacterium]